MCIEPEGYPRSLGPIDFLILATTENFEAFYPARVHDVARSVEEATLQLQVE